MIKSPAQIQRQTNIANLLTAARLVLSPVFVFVFLGWDSLGGAVTCLIIAVVSELTDLFDGMVARYRNEVTDFGKILDPLADSISRLTAFLCFAQGGWAPLYLVIFILYRDSMVATLRTYCAYKGVVVSARWSGKLKAWVQAIAIMIVLCLRIALYSFGPDYKSLFIGISYGAVAIATLVTVLSAVEYLSGNWKTLMRE